MKKLLIFAFLTAIVVSAVNAATTGKKEEIIGQWKYEVPTAPYGYETGTLLISEKEGEFAGEVKFADGYKIDLKNVRYTEGIFKCGLYIDYQYIDITAKVDGKILAGEVDTPEGKMKITAKKME